MKELKNPQNTVHLYGFINGVRLTELDGKTAINLDICTLEQYADKDGNSQTKRTFHDVALFTDDKKTIALFNGIAADCKKNAENRDVEGYTPRVHTLSAEGVLVNRGDTLQVMTSADTIKVDTKQEEKEVRNSAKLVGNVAKIAVYEDKKFAVVTLIHHYRPKDSDKDYETVVDIRVNGDRKYSKAAYDAIVSGDIKKGDFVRMGGQIHNNRYETENGVKYVRAIDLTSYEMLKHKEEKKEEVKEAPKAKKSAAKKTGETKKTVKSEKKTVRKGKALSA